MTPTTSKTPELLRQPTETALRVLAGKQTVEEAAQEHGVSVEEIVSWCSLLQTGASLAAKKRKRRMRLVGLLAVSLLLVGVTAAVAAPTPCPDTTLPLPAALKKFCPDEPASGTQLTANFTQMIKWIEQKAGPVDKPLPDNWIASWQIANGTITSTKLSLGAIVNNTAQISNGSLLGADVKNGTIEASRFAPGELVPLYEVNANCFAPNANLSSEATCLATTCSNNCGSLTAYKSCTSGCAAFSCGPVNSPPSCDNTLRGYILAP